MPLKTMRDDAPSINLTPMIDILLFLVIFFMIGSQLTNTNDDERDLAVRVPQVSPMPTAALASSKRVINVFGDGRIHLDGRQLSLADLERQLCEAKAQNTKTSVVVRGDSNSVYQSVADVIAVCRRADIQDVNLAVRVAQVER